MAARYNVKLVRRVAGEVADIQHRYVSAPGSKRGPRIAADKAEKAMLKAKKVGFRAVAAECVG